MGCPNCPIRCSEKTLNTLKNGWKWWTNAGILDVYSGSSTMSTPKAVLYYCFVTGWPWWTRWNYGVIVWKMIIWKMGVRKMKAHILIQVYGTIFLGIAVPPFKDFGHRKRAFHKLEMPFSQDRTALSPEYKFVVNKTPPKIWPNSAWFLGWKRAKNHTAEPQKPLVLKGFSGLS